MKFVPVCLLLGIILTACTAAETGDATSSPEATAGVLSTKTAPPTGVATATGAVVQLTKPVIAASSTPTKPTATPAELPTTTPTLDPTAAVAFGRTDEGAYFHGAPDAPVTLIDYSDFL